jgi:hypothetical protein
MPGHSSAFCNQVWSLDPLIRTEVTRLPKPRTRKVFTHETLMVARQAQLEGVDRKDQTVERTGGSTLLLCFRGRTAPGGGCFAVRALHIDIHLLLLHGRQQPLA